MTKEELLTELRTSITLARARGAGDVRVHWSRVNELLKESTILGCKSEADEIVKTVGVTQYHRNNSHTTFNNSSANRKRASVSAQR